MVQAPRQDDAGETKAKIKRNTTKGCRGMLWDCWPLTGANEEYTFEYAGVNFE